MSIFLSLMFYIGLTLVLIWFFYKYDLLNVLNGWAIAGCVVVFFIITTPLGFLIESYIKRNSHWDKVKIDDDRISSSRYGDIKFKEIKKFKVDDLNKIFSFKIITSKETFKFSCLEILGDDGGDEYKDDKIALKKMVDRLESVILEGEANIKVIKDSNSNVLFLLLCLAMVMLIPGLIFAPERMIFVIPFVVPLFFYALKKRKDKNQVDKK
ncbi:hypothetical protein [Serratia sp. DD3]|uniref:hypothetical protein n=1 Tax=Serratia sp. DD3 TaxID=1410619 RepID=UPI001267C8C8|nr:hypothetical protein [Serratia sp. DD3]